MLTSSVVAECNLQGKQPKLDYLGDAIMHDPTSVSFHGFTTLIPPLILPRTNTTPIYIYIYRRTVNVQHAQGVVRHHQPEKVNKYPLGHH